ncbi:hypothetical protein UFOVP747_30 [uncultured Caudovirales phage]|uniref:Uncharacterized protein n=1 Tax=uncultured Caudovirales phage TaxID=2100421 RepID=A0A6J7X3D4_9CAUD|nr:hypothetical protein UFOVP675_69 [uncultured Caudovirales phage]CAB5225445.1 hypothetical protein UFOVP747_30 [uncultured Caudovirales phage]
MPDQRPAARHLEVVEISTREVVKRVDVTGRSERQVNTCLAGLLRNMSERFYVRDTADEPLSQA